MGDSDRFSEGISRTGSTVKGITDAMFSATADLCSDRGGCAVVDAGGCRSTTVGESSGFWTIGSDGSDGNLPEDSGFGAIAVAFAICSSTVNGSRISGDKAADSEMMLVVTAGSKSVICGVMAGLIIAGASSGLGTIESGINSGGDAKLGAISLADLDI